MTTYSTLSVPALLEAFATSEPIPGGVSAAALAGATAVSLLLMVAGSPKTKTGAPEEAADLLEAAARLRPLREALTDLIDRDARAYEAVLAGLRLPKDSDTEKSARRAAIAVALQAATESPLDVMRLCQQALRSALIVVANGGASASSDARVAVELLLAVVRGAGLSIDANLAILKDQAFADRVRAERTQLDADGEADAVRIRQMA